MGLSGQVVTRQWGGTINPALLHWLHRGAQERASLTWLRQPAAPSSYLTFQRMECELAPSVQKPRLPWGGRNGEVVCLSKRSLGYNAHVAALVCPGCYSKVPQTQ